MLTFLAFVLALLTLLTISLQRTYAGLPLRELKHRARQGDEVAEALVKVVGYEHSLRAVLWFLIAITSAGFFVVVSRYTPAWFALTAAVVIVWLGFVWLPAAKVSGYSQKLAAWLAPLFSKILLYLHPMIDAISRLVHHYRPLSFHTGLYDRQDLIDLIEQQKVQVDSRIEATELDIAQHALTFGDIAIGERMVPKRQVKLVSVDDPLGPIIMDELHASGHSRFPVYEGKKTDVVGTLYLHDLVRAKGGGTVRELMKQKVYYLHEDQSLYDGLQAVLKTHHHLFIVVNEFEDFVGVISSEDILEAIVGRPIIDEFDQYDDLRAVAGRAASVQHQKHEPKPEPEQSEEQNDIEEPGPEPAEKPPEPESTEPPTE